MSTGEVLGIGKELDEEDSSIRRRLTTVTRARILHIAFIIVVVVVVAVVDR
jgi:hypothetical protein